jgi:carbamate kinase
MEVGAGFGNLLEMRVLIALGGKALLRGGEAAENGAQSIAAAAQVLAEIAAEHEVVITHDSEGVVRHMLELALRNALPDRDVVTVLAQVVVGADDPAFVAPSGVPSPDPTAIAELRSLRTLIDAGALVICAGGGGSPTVVDRDGAMRGVEAVVDRDLMAALLARRLDVDLFLMLADSTASTAEAARRFVEATERRAAIGALTDAVQIVRGAAGTQIAPRHA